MTKRIEYDTFPIHMMQSNVRFFIVLVKSIRVETSIDNLEKVYHRGIYAFSTRDERKRFTSMIQSYIDSDVEILYKFTKKPK